MMQAGQICSISKHITQNVSSECTVVTHAGNDLLDDLLLHGLEHRLLLPSCSGSGGRGILRQAAAGSCTQTAPLPCQRSLMLMLRCHRVLQYVLH
jgi:hypothetical protein